MVEEIWRPVVGLENMFEVSNQGRVRTVQRKVRFISKQGAQSWRVKASRVLAQQQINSGYLIVHMHHDNKRTAATVHSLVAAAFLGPRPVGADVCHNNGRKTDNRAENLRYDSRTNNHLDRIAHGTIYDGATRAKLTPAVVRLLRGLNDNGDLDQTAVAKAYGVTSEAIRRAVKGETWRYVA